MLIPATILTVIIQIGLPLALAFWVTRRFSVSWKLVLVGVLTFVGSQVLHIPIVNAYTAWFSSGSLRFPNPPTAYLFNAVVLGLLAGIFEESARAVGYRIMRRARRWPQGLAMGIGHGGIESILIGGITLASLLTMISLRGLSPEELSALPNATALEIQMNAFWSTPWTMAFAGAVERVIAISLHLAFSLLVLLAFVRRSAWYFLAAVLWHTVVDAVTVYLVQLGAGVWTIEGVLLALGVVNLVVLLWSIRQLKRAEAAPVETTAVV